MNPSRALLSDSFEVIAVSELNLKLNWEIIDTRALLVSENVKIEKISAVWKVSLLKLSSSSDALKFNLDIDKTVSTDMLQENTFRVKVSNIGYKVFLKSADYFWPMSSHFSENIYVSSFHTNLNIMVTVCGRRESIDTSNVIKRIINNNITMLNDPKYSDFIFIVNGKEFKVHKNILAANSPVFDKMFSSNMRESQKNNCVIKNINPSVFGHMLNFIYGGILPKDFKDISISLYGVAHFYQLKDLMDVCKSVMRSNLSTANAEEVYICANLYDLEDLKKDAIKIGNIVKAPTTETLQSIIERKKTNLLLLKDLEALAACETV